MIDLKFSTKIIKKLYRRAGRGKGKVQRHRRRPGHRLRGAHPQGISSPSSQPTLKLVLYLATPTANDSLPHKCTIDVFLHDYFIKLLFLS